MASKYLAKGLKRSALSIALGLCFAGSVQAQSTTGNVYGSATAGSTVTVKNASGLTRTITVDESGRYNISNLPVGNYTVTVEQGGKQVSSSTVTVRAGAGAEASLGTVTVSAKQAPLIDITATDTRSVLTSEQIERLPLGHSAEAIALLAPGAVQGAAGFFGGLVSFGGAGVSENAYYVNGYFTGEPLSNLGGFGLPYGTILQQETFIGGYSAKYGRSDGGVINQIGKRGTNDWHFGGQVFFTPRSWRGNQRARYFPNIDLSGPNSNPNLPSTCEMDGEDADGNPVGPTVDGDYDELCQWSLSDLDPAHQPGQLYDQGKSDEAWNHQYDVYVGGPIIKDRLFFFASAEWTKNESIAAPTILGTQRTTDTEQDVNKQYAKIDWNITDNHFLEFTYLREDNDTDGTFHDYDFDTDTRGDLLSTVPDPVYQTNRYMIGKYTGYLTDNVTLSVLYGEGKLTKQSINPSIEPGIPFISSPSLQNPALNGGVPRSSTAGGFQGTDAEDDTKGLRADLEWVLGDHTLTFGIDNINFEAINEGVDQVAQRWIYGRTTGNIVPGVVGKPSAAPGNPDGYYVYDYVLVTATGMELKQKAWYVEDRWQVTDNLLLSLGVRNDQFTNINSFGETYLDAKNQWAPRLGFAWDVNGDSTFKVFGNAGRYFLAMPNNVAIRGASASTFTREYFTYTGIDANGGPTGLTPVPRLDGGSGPFSSNGEYGQPIDVLSFAPSDLKNMYQDEYLLGFEAALGKDWMMGVKLTYRDLKSAIDDICDVDAMSAALEAANIDPDSVEIPGCFMFNPGGKNTFSLKNVDGNGRTEISMTSDDWGFTEPMKRTYKGMDIYFERPFDGKWEARVDYTFSKGQGNMEGQVKSEFGQSNISKTQDWDAAAIMAFANGYLANDRRHQVKARGSYQITDELLLGLNLTIKSGAPISCLGFFNPDGSTDENSDAADPIQYGASYHTCLGAVASPGSIRTPWTHVFDLGLTYRPNYFDKKLAVGVQARNIFNERNALQVDVTSETAPYSVSNTYQVPIALQQPRSVAAYLSYDW